jgi:hypothetical protein
MYRWSRYMLEGISLDRLRTFLAAVDEGSFSAAAKAEVSNWQRAIREATTRLSWGNSRVQGKIDGGYGPGIRFLGLEILKIRGT